MSDKNLLETFLNRRSVRKYSPVIDEEKFSADLEKILQAGLLSPSGHAKYPVEMVVIRDRNTLEKLSHCRVNVAKMLNEASAAVIVIADKNKADTIIEDSSITMMAMHIMATSLDLGSCWIQLHNRTAEDDRDSEIFVRDVLNIPENYHCQAILSIGIPAGQIKPRQLEKLHYEKIHREQF